MTMEAAAASLAVFDPEGATEMQVSRMEPVLQNLSNAIAPIIAPHHAAADAAAEVAATGQYADEAARAKAIAVARAEALGPAGPLESALNESLTRLRNQRRHWSNVYRYPTSDQLVERSKDDGSEHASMAALTTAQAALS